MTKNGNPLVLHAGQAFGQPSSFWAEAYGIMPAIYFLSHASIYTNTTQKLGFDPYLDNESVITQ
eukprot:11575751-Ditylum_brightwellii.AAC.1